MGWLFLCFLYPIVFFYIVFLTKTSRYICHAIAITRLHKLIFMEPLKVKDILFTLKIEKNGADN